MFSPPRKGLFTLTRGGSRLLPRPQTASRLWGMRHTSALPCPEYTRIQQEGIQGGPLVHLALTLPQATGWRSEAWGTGVGDEGWAVPPNCHHLHFLSPAAMEDLAVDGYESAWTPPYPFCRRVWVGATVEWEKNRLCVGDEAEQRTRCTRMEKAGPSGWTKAWMEKVIHNQNGLSIRETYCLAYHPDPVPTTPTTASSTPRPRKVKTSDFSRPFTSTATMLFRYSALTGNAHRVHYDSAYAKDVEGYPGVLLHGPFSATLLLSLLTDHLRASERIRAFSYRLLTPVHVEKTIMMHGRWTSPARKACDLWATTSDGRLALRGTAQLAHDV